MLILYKKTYEKIAMGLLSYMPDETNVRALQERMHHYETDTSSELFLWKEGEDIIGLLGIEVDEESFTIHDIAVNPSYRGEGIGKKIVEEIQQAYPEKTCKSTEITQNFLEKCQDVETGRTEK